MPTDQWFSRSTAALNTNTAPDILFNDGFRLVQIQQQTHKLSDLTPDMQAGSGGRPQIPLRRRHGGRDL